MAELDDQSPLPSRPPALARELSGDLKCVRCGYNLRGLSVRSLCPECGLPVRATLLSVVDPRASELQPIRRPMLVYAGLVVWSVCSLAAVSCTWAIRLLEYVAVSANAGHAPTETLSNCVVALWVCASLGIFLLIRPHDALPRWTTLGVLVAAIAYLLLAAANYSMLKQDDDTRQTLYVTGVSPGVMRTLHRVIEDAAVFASIAGLGRLWRTFQSRSVLMRSGRLDRQSTPSMYAAAAIVAAGDIFWLIAAPPAGIGIEGSLMRFISQALIVVGSMLLTVGLMAILMDVVRLRKVILAMPLSLDQATRPEGAGLTAGSP